MQYTNILRWVLRIGLCAVFFVCFIVAGGWLFPATFFPFITGKNFVFRILIELLFGVYVLLALREPKYRPRASYLLWAVTIFVAWVAVTTMLSVDPIKSFWSNFERMEGYITVLHLFAYFIMLGAVASAEAWWERLMQASIAAGALQALYSLGQLLHVGGLAPSSQSGPRLDGTFGNATYLAVFMLFNSFLTLFMLVRQRRSAQLQALYGIALVLQVATLYYTETRGALLGFVGGLIVAAIYIALRAKGSQWQQLRKISLYGLGVLVVLAALFLGLRNTTFVKNSSTLSRLASISVTDPTTQARFQIWGMAYQGFKDRPIQGWGQENFNFVFNKYYTPVMYSQEQWFDRAHNQFLDWLIAAGLPAFLLYVSFFVLAAWLIVRSDALAVPEQAILLGLLAGYAFNNLFVFDDLMSSVYFFTILAFVHGLSSRRVPRWMFLSKPMSERGVALVLPVLLVVVFGGAWALNAPGIARAENLLTAIETEVPVSNGSGGITGQAKDPKVQLQQFQTALGENTWPGTPMGYQETVEQLLQYASTLSGSTSVDPSVIQDTDTAASNAGLALLKARPHDARLELFVGAFYGTAGQYQLALQYLNMALADSPQKQQIMFEVGVTYLNAGDSKDAVPVLKAAFEEEPQYNDARILYVSALMYAGDMTDADALLMQGFGTVLYDDPRLLQVYVNTKQYQRVIGIWKSRVAASPDDAQMHIGLAAAYFSASDKVDAITELQNAAKLDPTLQTQVQALITQINNGTLKPGQ